MQPLFVDRLRRVRDGQRIEADDIAAIVDGASDGSVPDYQLAAFLMAVYQRGLADEATAELTLRMRDSGAVLCWPSGEPLRVDKHSTGGVGDKISLHLAPWVAACGASVPMVAGRGLGHTGGTLDKLDSIPGFRHALDLAEFQRLVLRNGCAIMGQSGEFAPADGRLYALRDVTATIESVPLITASILAKKLAEGIDALVLDVKVGRGAFMKTREKARALAHSICRVGALAGLRVQAVLSRMDAPLGRAIGNALEVRESLAVLQGRGPHDVVELSYALGARMLHLGGQASSLTHGRALMEQALLSGAAYQRFAAMVTAQGGLWHSDEAQPLALPVAPKTTLLPASRSGFVVEQDAFVLGQFAVALGAGRARIDDDVDLAVGVVLLAAVGDALQQGEPWAIVHHRADLSASDVARAQSALRLSEAPPPPAPLVLETIDSASEAL